MGTTFGCGGTAAGRLVCACFYVRGLQILLRMHSLKRAEKELKMMQAMDDEAMLTQLCSAWVSVAQVGLLKKDKRQRGKYRNCGVGSTTKLDGRKGDAWVAWNPGWICHHAMNAMKSEPRERGRERKSVLSTCLTIKV